MLTDKVQAKVEWDVTDLVCVSECGIIVFFFNVFYLPVSLPMFPNFYSVPQSSPCAFGHWWAADLYRL